MKRILAGRDVEAIGLGCMGLSWAYGIPPSNEDGARLLHRALDLGYDHLDTARIYGVGHNEMLIGEALAGRRNEFFLASKTGIIVDGDKRRIDCRPETIRAAIEQSLTLLKTDHIDLYYLHRPDFATPIEESVGELARAVEAGKIGSIGLSEMSAETLRRAASVHPIAAMQTEYSPWTRNPEIAVLDACAELGTTFVAFSPVARGVLAGAVRDPATLINEDLRRGMPRFKPDNWPTNLALVDAFEAIAAEQGVTPAQLSLAWVLSRGEHVVAIPGTASIAHLEENFARRDWTIPTEVAARIDTLFAPEAIAGPRYAPAAQASVSTEEFA
ncbi:MAG: aldo/keto reductase [Sphingomonas sp.]|jgi:aryl-alcohol dehydrogenase-like predicted oxidoreductase|uniref:aldo/keto reductase n=1 Tax=Sphingomonas sp. TaxID=28214 RepID=UPI0035616105